jgi:hypothetical protein
MPFGVGFAKVTLPTGEFGLCCSSSFMGSWNFAPIGSTTSPMRSGVGVDAIPRIVTKSSLSSKDFSMRRL